MKPTHENYNERACPPVGVPHVCTRFAYRRNGSEPVNCIHRRGTDETERHFGGFVLRPYLVYCSMYAARGY